ncbi:hypothetical protein SAMD00019534_122050 [Acytostelium subglobosum LB1]|uniref:hypothetical protein n=1 Tax=Acytostelium subglobosum LB1 TaxID=1410327 RepID=UPI00064509F2|nr:hypothetical protein SAMD00019534_122050 [Acytostelium subglobosum LB1]GAM29029.1 hypothetical protein SAMD00019534_122050 [Acytostelium subglobosum LB1]|eukprot:XP_012748035.1 hypothetical protein SAMD00019534_122050 [Acytostelium subglobosum LB1]
MNNKALFVPLVLLLLQQLWLRQQTQTQDQVVLQHYDYTLDSNSSVSNPPQGFMHFGFGPYVANQGKVSIENDQDVGRYLRVDSNPFTLTAPQSPGGSLDHVKWLALTQDSYPLPTQGQELVCSFTIRSQSFGTERHPFGNAAVLDPHSDLRLATVAVNSLDFNTNLVADFLVTDRMIYVLYERLPFGPGGYAAFVFAIPAMERASPKTFVDLAIAWDFENKMVRWLINGKEVYRITSVGYRLSREHMIIDRGGREELVFPSSVQCGGGTFTLMDASAPCHRHETTIGGGRSCMNSAELSKGLVRLDAGEPTAPYNSPRSGNHNQTFHDEQSLDSNRIFGQGAILDIKSLKVYQQSNSRNN